MNSWKTLVRNSGRISVEIFKENLSIINERDPEGLNKGTMGKIFEGISEEINERSPGEIP